MDNIAQDLGTNVKIFRERLGLSQEALAEKIEVSVTTIQNIERGRKWVGVRTIARLSQALKVSQHDLFVDPCEKKPWEILLRKIGKLLLNIPPDILFALSDVKDWEPVRKIIKRVRRRK